MARPKKLKWSKVGLGEWQGFQAEADRQPQPVAVAVKSGTHLDDYPWDWYFTDFGTTLVPDAPLPCAKGDKCDHPSRHRRHHAGVTDTLRAAKQQIEETLA